MSNTRNQIPVCAGAEILVFLYPLIELDRAYLKKVGLVLPYLFLKGDSICLKCRVKVVPLPGSLSTFIQKS